MTEYKYRTVDFRPAPTGWRVVFLDGTGRASITPMPGWFIQEEIEVEYGEERPTGDRQVTAGHLEETGVEPVTADAYFWMILAPDEPEPTPTEQASEFARRKAETERMARAAQARRAGAEEL